VVVFSPGFVDCPVVWLIVPESERYALEASWLCGGLKLTLLPFTVPYRMSWPEGVAQKIAISP